MLRKLRLEYSGATHHITSRGDQRDYVFLGEVDKYGFLSPGNFSGLTPQTHFHYGSERIKATERLTKELLSDFKDYVRTHAKPCGQCQRAFLGGN